MRHRYSCTLAAAAFDYAENVSTVIVMERFPDRVAVFEWLAPLFTVTKWGLLAASFALLAAGVAWVA